MNEFVKWNSMNEFVKWTCKMIIVICISKAELLLFKKTTRFFKKHSLFFEKKSLRFQSLQLGFVCLHIEAAGGKWVANYVHMLFSLIRLLVVDIFYFSVCRFLRKQVKPCQQGSQSRKTYAILLRIFTFGKANHLSLFLKNYFDQTQHKYYIFATLNCCCNN